MPLVKEAADDENGQERGSDREAAPALIAKALPTAR